MTVEAVTRQGRPVLQRRAFAVPGTREDAIYRGLLSRLRRIGYLTYACPQCGAAVDYGVRKRR